VLDSKGPLELESADRPSDQSGPPQDQTATERRTTRSTGSPV